MPGAAVKLHAKRSFVNHGVIIIIKKLDNTMVETHMSVTVNPSKKRDAKAMYKADAPVVCQPPSENSTGAQVHYVVGRGEKGAQGEYMQALLNEIRARDKGVR